MRGTYRRHRNMRCGERRRIVQAVADHHYPETLPFQVAYAGDFISRGDAGAPLADPERLRSRLHGRLPIARENLDGDAARLERGTRDLRTRAQTLQDRKYMPHLASVKGDDRHFRIETQNLIC